MGILPSFMLVNVLIFWKKKEVESFFAMQVIDFLLIILDILGYPNGFCMTLNKLILLVFLDTYEVVLLDQKSTKMHQEQ
jgi:uncharacterized membrane protein